MCVCVFVLLANIQCCMYMIIMSIFGGSTEGIFVLPLGRICPPMSLLSKTNLRKEIPIIRHCSCSQIEEVYWSVSARESTLNKLVEQEKALEQSFVESVGENNKFKDFLLKVFRKKIKRAKRKQEEVAKEGEEEEEDEDEGSEESDSDYIR